MMVTPAPAPMIAFWIFGWRRRSQVEVAAFLAVHPMPEW
jgi:hypothetical protein